MEGVQSRLSAERGSVVWGGGGAAPAPRRRGGRAGGGGGPRPPRGAPPPGGGGVGQKGWVLFLRAWCGGGGAGARPRAPPSLTTLPPGGQTPQHVQQMCASDG